MARRGYLKALSKQSKRLFVFVADFLRQFRTIIRIFLLVSSLAVFSVIGGFLFQLVESPPEQHTINFISRKRHDFLVVLFKVFTAGKPEKEEKSEFDNQLGFYSNDYTAAIRNGTFFIDGKPNPQWTFEGSTYFCVTTFTQLGFGNLAPKSLLGRFVSVLYAFFSIPVGAIVFAELGIQLNSLIISSWRTGYKSYMTIKEQANEDVDKYEKFDQTLNKSKKELIAKFRKREKAKGPSKWTKFMNDVRGVVERDTLANVNARQDVGGGGDESNMTTSVDSGLNDKNSNNRSENTTTTTTALGVDYCQGLRRRIRFSTPSDFYLSAEKEHGEEAFYTRCDCPSSTNEDAHYLNLNVDGDELPIRRKEQQPDELRSQNLESQGCLNTNGVYNKRYCRVSGNIIERESQKRERNFQRIRGSSAKSHDFFRKIATSPCCPFIVRLAYLNNIIYDKMVKKLFVIRVRKYRLKGQGRLTRNSPLMTVSQATRKFFTNITSYVTSKLYSTNDPVLTSVGGDLDRFGREKIGGKPKSMWRIGKHEEGEEEDEVNNNNSTGFDLSDFEGMENEIEAQMKARLNEMSDDEDDMSEGNVHDVEPTGLIVMNSVMTLGYVVLGTFITTLFESWNYMDGAWFLIMSVLTVGYGDVIPADTKSFAYFMPYIILGMAIFANVISMCMRSLTRVTGHISNIGKDMYNTANARSAFHRIRRRGQRARRRWLILRQHVLNGLPKTLTDESREHKRLLVQREKEVARDAYRIYFSLFYKDKLAQIKRATVKALARRKQSSTMSSKHFSFLQSQQSEMQDAWTMYEPPWSFCKRLKWRTRRRYEKFKAALVPSVDFM